MEHTQNTRIVVAAALVLAAATGSLAGCATASPSSEQGRAVITHRMLVRESADRYVDELIERARISKQPSASGVDAGQVAVRFVPNDLDPRGRHVVPESLTTEAMHRMLVRVAADRYVAELLGRARASSQQSTGVDDYLSPSTGQ
jgi:hypothetical protein